MTAHNLRLKAFVEPHIASGQKDIEIRVADEKRQKIAPGDILRFHVKGSVYERTVKEIRRYRDFNHMLEHESLVRIMPGYSRVEVLAALWKLFPPDKEALGVLAFELETIK